MSAYSKADRSIEKGELWRAKENLQGHLSTSKYDVELFEKYGSVLLGMGDLLEAGKYLFLSGVRKKEYEEAIGIYLGRFSKKATGQLFHTFPRAAQSSPFSAYPGAVLEELKERGHREEEVKVLSDRHNGDEPDTFGSKVIVVISLVVIFGLLAGLVIQGYRGLLWAWGQLVN